MSVEPRHAVAAYAARFHEALGPLHAAASPLGAWILLALVAPLAHGPLRDALEQALGLPAGEASEFARQLLDQPHPAVSAAVATWTRPGIRGDAVAAWLDRLPAPVERGDIPEPAAADAWVRRATRGMIERMPLPPLPASIYLFASALATDIAWPVPYELADSSALGDCPWAKEVRQVLRTWEIQRPIFETPTAGPVAAHLAVARGDVILTSVIAAPDVPHHRVLAAAHAIGMGGVRELKRHSLFELPLGDGHSWTITEKREQSYQGDTHSESARAVLPAWKAGADLIDLMTEPAFGFQAAAAAVHAVLPLRAAPSETAAVQTTTATYDRRGFRAASVTEMMEFETFAQPHPGIAVHRHAEVRFNRPYAVVAYADVERQPKHPWRGLPIFSAWVTTPMEADARELERQTS
jgi:hypothetical protein